MQYSSMPLKGLKVKKFYTIKELCKLTQLSVRTIHYYDEINLLRPTQRTNKGHRLYSEENLWRLQQIVTLKFIGFSLSQIKNLLQKNDLNILDSLIMQAKVLADEENRIKKISYLVNDLIKQNELTQSIDWKSVTSIIEIIQSKGKDTQVCYEKYLTTIELKRFKQYAKTRTQEWQLLFEEVKSNIHVDPESQAGIDLAKKWLKLADVAYKDFPELKEKLWKAYQVGVIPQDDVLILLLIMLC